MIQLAISTVTGQSSIALYDGQTPLALRFGAWPGEALMENIQMLCWQAGVSLKKINVIAVVAGPGGFTGLRVGLTTAKTLAYTLQKKLITVDALEATAAQIAPLAVTLMVVQKACRDEHNVALFGQTRLTPNTVMRESEIVESLLATEGALYLGGDGAPVVYPLLLKKNKKTKVKLMIGFNSILTAHGVALAAYDLYRQKIFANPLRVIPAYSHPPNIIMSKNLNYEQLKAISVG